MNTIQSVVLFVPGWGLIIEQNHTHMTPKVPMIPTVLIGLLAISRLGAIHTVVFGGFAPQALAQRIDASRPRAILTASCGIDGNKPPTPYRDLLVEAGRLATWETPRTIVWQREALGWHPLRRERGERNWNRLVRSAMLRREGGGVGRKGKVFVACVPFKSGDPAYVIYTSGTTGLPKGVVREAGGHAVGLATSMRQMFGMEGPGDVVSLPSPLKSLFLFLVHLLTKRGRLIRRPQMACFSDIGWVVGHSFTLYGPLLVGAATVLYEGKPVGTPDAGAFWRMIDEYRVNAMFTAPTALRAIRKEDPENKHLRHVGEAGGLRSLRAMFLAGERSEPAIVTMYQDLLGRYGGGGGGGGGAKVVDNWWSSESGSPISGISMAPERALGKLAPATATRGGLQEARGGPPPPLEVKPGSAGKPMPGFDVRVVDDQGKELGRGRMGNMVLKMPLAPTAFRTLWGDEERFYKGYLKRFGGKWLDTGDAGIVDEDGYVHIMARSDDIINVAAHRLSTGEHQAVSCTQCNVRTYLLTHIRNARTSHHIAPARDRGVRGGDP